MWCWDRCVGQLIHHGNESICHLINIFFCVLRLFFFNLSSSSPLEAHSTVQCYYRWQHAVLKSSKVGPHLQTCSMPLDQQLPFPFLPRASSDDLCLCFWDWVCFNSRPGAQQHCFSVPELLHSAMCPLLYLPLFFFFNFYFGGVCSVCRFSDHSLPFCMAGAAQSWYELESFLSSGTKMLLRFPEAITPLD